MFEWNQVAIPTIITIVTSIVLWFGKSFYGYLRRDGIADLKRAEYDYSDKFQDNLMTQLTNTQKQLEKTNKDLDKAWQRVREEERARYQLEREVVELRSKVASCEERLAGLEVENEELKARLESTGERW